MTEVPPIRLAGVGKRYVKYDDAPTLVGHALRLRGRTRRSRLWALRGVDLEVAPGEAVGVIGRNGSGKSTLLRLLAGVTAPTEGRVEVTGRVAPLISLGVGFHPELTGRENVYVNGVVLGLSRRQLDERLDAIVDFAELPAFVDTPVKFYSSGMFVRLGFAVALAAQPEVLLVDEVLAVGDLAFQLRCFERMRALQEAGTTIVVVSHNLHAIRNLCSRTVVLDGGVVSHDGGTAEGIARYHELLGQHTGTVDSSGAAVGEVTDPALVVEEFSLEDAGGEQVAHVDTGEEVVLRVAARALRDVEDVTVEVGIFNELGVEVYADRLAWAGPRKWTAGETVERAARLRMSLGTGSYAALAWLSGPDGRLLAQPPRPAVFFVAGREGTKGVADLDAAPVTPSSPARSGREPRA